MKKLLLIALLFGATAQAENTIFSAQDPYADKVVEEVVKPVAKAGFWALMGYLAITIKF